MKMGAISLDFHFSKNVDGIAADPQPDWSFDALLSELNSLEIRIQTSLNLSSSSTINLPRGFSIMKDKNANKGAFVMQLSDTELDMESDREEEDDGHDDGRARVASRRFTCDELALREDEEYEEKMDIGIHKNLMDATTIEEGALFELLQDQQLSVMEDIRSQMMELETDLVDENKKHISKLASAEKYAETRKEMDRNIDLQYQRRIGEALDNHLTAVQKDHEHKSRIEEKRIRDDAIREEARRKEKALCDEILQQERIRAETEARLEAERVKAAAEEASRKAAAEEASRKAAKEVEEKEAAEKIKISNARAAENSAVVTQLQQKSVSHVTKSALEAGTSIRSSRNALKLAEQRLKTYSEVAAHNDVLRSSFNTDYQKHGQKIARNIRQISGSKENVRAKANALIALIGDPSYPQSVNIATFTEKFVSLCENPSGSFSRVAYAYAQVIVLVTSKVPLAMDILVAELNRACIYTVPKHVAYSKAAFETTNAYYKALGFREEDGKIEERDNYLERLRSYMKLYGALVQTEVPGVQNFHGISEGWAWLARFLNALPPNIYTAVALLAFLEMAGFTLYRKYRSQFKKILHTIDRDFLSPLSEKGDPNLSRTIAEMSNYLQSNQFLKEPEGWKLMDDLESHYVSGF